MRFLSRMLSLLSPRPTPTYVREHERWQAYGPAWRRRRRRHIHAFHRRRRRVRLETLSG
jgi:hypothetical protein